MDTRSKSKTKSRDTELETDIELEEQEYVTHQYDLSGSAYTEDDGEMEDSATDGGEVEPSVRPRRPPTDSHPPDSPPPPSLFLITDTYPVRRPSFPSTDGTSTRSLPPSPPSQVGKARKSYMVKPSSLFQG